MPIYPRIKENEREKIPPKDRCEVSYNGYHTLEVVRETPMSVPVMICTKCQKLIEIKFPSKELDNSVNKS